MTLNLVWKPMRLYRVRAETGCLSREMLTALQRMISNNTNAVLTLNLTSVMASYSPFHTLLQLLVFAVSSNSCCWCSSLEMFTRLSPVVPRASHTPSKWNLQPPPAQELNFNRTKQSNGRRRPERGKMGRESAKGHLSVRRTRPGCAGCRPLEPRLICTGALVPLSQRADSDQAGSSKTELAQIPRFLAHYLHFVMLMFICPEQIS